MAGDRGWQIAEYEGRWVAVLLWCAAAKRLKARETWISWDPRTRAERLKLVVQQARFCLLHAQPNLASRVLGEAVRHLPDWWKQRHGYTPLLAETFVDPSRFEGTCNRAAGWTEAGVTTGHRRAGRAYYEPGAGLKSLWLKALRQDAAVRLRGPLATLPPECRAAQPEAAMGVLPVKLAQAESLLAAFARVPDPRARNSHHRLATVLTITALAILMGRQRPADFVRLAQQLNARQRQALGYYRPPGKKLGVAPDSDVFYTLLGRVDPAALAAVLNDWLQAQHDQIPPGARPRRQSGHRPTRAGHQPRRATDRRHRRPRTCALRREGTRSARRPRRRRARGPRHRPTFSTDDCDHGRAEHRALTLATVTPLQLGFPQAATVVAVTSAVTNKKTGAESAELRLVVSSLERGALTPRQGLARVRGHWSVEAANHYRSDITWREDHDLGRHARRACNLALLRSALLGALLRDGSINLSARSQHYASHPSAAPRFLSSSLPSL